MEVYENYGSVTVIDVSKTTFNCTKCDEYYHEKVRSVNMTTANGTIEKVRKTTACG